MKQKSLLSFFGQPKKKHRLNDDASNNNHQTETNKEQNVQVKEQKGQVINSSNLQNILRLAESAMIDKSISDTSNDEVANQDKGTKTLDMPEKEALKTEE